MPSFSCKDVCKNSWPIIYYILLSIWKRTFPLPPAGATHHAPPPKSVHPMLAHGGPRATTVTADIAARGLAILGRLMINFDSPRSRKRWRYSCLGSTPSSCKDLRFGLTPSARSDTKINCCSSSSQVFCVPRVFLHVRFYWGCQTSDDCHMVQKWSLCCTGWDSDFSLTIEHVVQQSTVFQVHRSFTGDRQEYERMLKRP